MSLAKFRRIFSDIGPLQIVIILLVLATAIIHLQHGLSGGMGGPGGAGHPPTGAPGNPPAGAPGNPPTGARPAGGPGGPSGAASLLMNLPIPLSTLFILNFVGYLVLLIALYLRALQPIQHLVRWLLIAFAVLTITAWFIMAGAQPTTLGIVDKVIEGALILLLLIEEALSFRSHLKARARPANGDFSQPATGSRTMSGVTK